MQFVSVLKQLRLLGVTQRKVKFPVKALLSPKSGTLDAAEEKSAPPLMDVSLLHAQSSNLCYPRGFSPLPNL